MKKSIAFIALIPSLLCACIKHDKPVDQTNQVKLLKYTFANMDEDVMPISGWVAPSSLVNLNTLEQYQILKESGLNCIYDLYEQYGVTLTRKDDQGVPHSYPAKDEIYKALDYASQVGIKYFVRDATLWNNQGEAFKNAFEKREYTKYSGFGGFLYTDEPKTHEDFLRIASAREKFTQYVGDKYAFYVNLNPMQYFTSNGGDIDEYITALKEANYVVDDSMYDAYLDYYDYGIYFVTSPEGQFTMQILDLTNYIIGIFPVQTAWNEEELALKKKGLEEIYKKNYQKYNNKQSKEDILEEEVKESII